MNVLYLEKEIKGRASVKGYKLIRVYQCKYVSCYKKICLETGIYSYEVFERRFSKPRFDSQFEFDLVENYPYDELFGVSAFDCSTKKEAISKIKYLIKRCKDKELKAD